PRVAVTVPGLIVSLSLRTMSPASRTPTVPLSAIRFQLSLTKLVATVGARRSSSASRRGAQRAGRRAVGALREENISVSPRDVGRDDRRARISFALSVGKCSGPFLTPHLVQSSQSSRID